MAKKLASTVVNIALDEVGYLEKASNSNLDDKTANAGSANYTKYGRDMHEIYPSVMDFPAYWCDAFVDWCFYKAYGVSNAKSLLGGDFNDYTVSSAQLYKNKGAYYTSNPKYGDQIFFKNSTRICHTGLVYKVDSNYVYTVEGNTSGASGVVSNGGGVAAKKYSLTDSSIDGYGRPAYDDDDDDATTSTYSDTFPVLPPRGWYQLGDGYLTLVNYPTQLKRLQRFLNWCIDAGLSVDGKYGPKTEQAVISFQSAYGLTADGEFGVKSLAKAKTVEK